MKEIYLSLTKSLREIIVLFILELVLLYKSFRR